MENTKEAINGNTRYQAFCIAAPHILACCWFFGSILIGLLVFFGITSYNGEHLDVSKCLDWIIDIQNIDEDKIYYCLSRLTLAILYIVYIARILKVIIQSINFFRQAIKSNAVKDKRTQAILNLNKSFGSVCGLSAMHVLWACLLGASCSSGKALAVVLIGAIVFMMTGIIANYTQQTPNAIAYVVVDTLRNLLAITVAIGLIHKLQIPAIADLYQGILFIVNTIEESAVGTASIDIKALLLSLYNGLFYPVLRMILWLISIGIIKYMAGCQNYAFAKKEGKVILGKLYKTCIFSLVIMAITCVIKAMCESVEIVLILPAQLKANAPIIMLSVAGILLFKFTYPAQYIEKRESNTEKNNEEPLQEETTQ